MGRLYFAESKMEARQFIKFWSPSFSKIYPLKISWNIKGIERSPGWVPLAIELPHIEYG